MSSLKQQSKKNKKQQKSVTVPEVIFSETKPLVFNQKPVKVLEKTASQVKTEEPAVIKPGENSITYGVDSLLKQLGRRYPSMTRPVTASQSRRRPDIAIARDFLKRTETLRSDKLLSASLKSAKSLRNNQSLRVTTMGLKSLQTAPSELLEKRLLVKDEESPVNVKKKRVLRAKSAQITP